MEKIRKMMYVHGFASSGSSGTVMNLRRSLPGWRVIAPDLPVDPFESLELLRSIVEAVLSPLKSFFFVFVAFDIIFHL